MWTHNEGKDIKKTKHFLTRGLQRHPKCQELYQTYISIELSTSEDLSTELTLMENTHSEQSLAVERAKLIYETSKAELTIDEDYLESIIRIVEPFSFASSLYSIVKNDLENLDLIEDE